MSLTSHLGYGPFRLDDSSRETSSQGRLALSPESATRSPVARPDHVAIWSSYGTRTRSANGPSHRSYVDIDIRALME